MLISKPASGGIQVGKNLKIMDSPPLGGFPSSFPRREGVLQVDQDHSGMTALL